MVVGMSYELDYNDFVMYEYYICTQSNLECNYSYNTNINQSIGYWFCLGKFAFYQFCVDCPLEVSWSPSTECCGNIIIFISWQSSPYPYFLAQFATYLYSFRHSSPHICILLGTVRHIFVFFLAQFATYLYSRHFFFTLILLLKDFCVLLNYNKIRKGIVIRLS